ncbi:hypothetical protein OBBRIDRAFT_808818 [Obba rivulosa]|uniref:SET domain-containing protein n=1 Tax=Obba rivulosa TaxID=1052685 RepID=A0A8E2AKU4_9APHY|nr:hypothetical protein OBBRIDRAFT_808818 [Obba rivulosa]
MQRKFLRPRSSDGASSTRDSNPELPQSSDSKTPKELGIVEIPSGFKTAPRFFDSSFDPFFDPSFAEGRVPLMTVTTFRCSLPPEAYTTVICLEEIKDALSAQSDWLAFFSPPSPPLYEVKAAGRGYGRGVSVFAIRDINVGDTHHAGASTIDHIHQDGVPQEVYLEQCLDIMHPPRWEAFLALHNCYGPDMHPLCGIIQANSLGVGSFSGPSGLTGAYSAVFNDLSHVNHSPNVWYQWNLDTFTDQIRALRPIKAREQIYIIYCIIDQPRATRQGNLV